MIDDYSLRGRIAFAKDVLEKIEREWSSMSGHEMAKLLNHASTELDDACVMIRCADGSNQ